MRAAAVLALAIALWPGPADAARSVVERDPPPVLGTMPAYPGATRPLPAWESAYLAIAMTGDKPAAVIAYYMDRMLAAGWTPGAGEGPEAMAAALAGQPAWLSFTRKGFGRLDVQVTTGTHPKTGAPVTMIFYQREPAPH